MFCGQSSSVCFTSMPPNIEIIQLTTHSPKGFWLDFHSLNNVSRKIMYWTCSGSYKHLVLLAVLYKKWCQFVKLPSISWELHSISESWAVGCFRLSIGLAKKFVQVFTSDVMTTLNELFGQPHTCLLRFPPGDSFNFSHVSFQFPYYMHDKIVTQRAFDFSKIQIINGRT